MRRLSEYFRIELEKLGYEPGERTYNWTNGKRSGTASEPTIYWSLGYCQGDGMAWEGRCNLEKLADRLLVSKERAAVKRVLAKDAVSDDRITHSGNYYHWNSMSVNVEIDYRYEDDLTALERASFDAFVAAIDEDVKATSKRLERDGYAINEHCSPAWFVKDPVREGFGERSWAVIKEHTIGRFRVEVKLEEDDHFSIYESGETMLDHELAKQVVAGELVCCGVIVTIFDAEDDTELGSASLWGITDDADLKYIRRDVIFELFDEAKDEAREKVAKLAARYSRRPGATDNHASL